MKSLFLAALLLSSVAMAQPIPAPCGPACLSSAAWKWDVQTYLGDRTVLEIDVTLAAYNEGVWTANDKSLTTLDDAKCDANAESSDPAGVYYTPGGVVVTPAAVRCEVAALTRYQGAVLAYPRLRLETRRRLVAEAERLKQQVAAGRNR